MCVRTHGDFVRFSVFFLFFYSQMEGIFNTLSFFVLLNRRKGMGLKVVFGILLGVFGVIYY